MSKKNREMYAINQEKQLKERFINLALNRFEWDGLPNGLESDDIERMLITHGKLFAFNHEVNGLTILPCTPTSDINIYHKPTKYNVIGNNFNKKFDVDEGVLLKNNALGVEDISTIANFCERINKVEQTQDVNLFQQNIPYVVVGDEKDRLTIQKVLNDMLNFKFVMWFRKGFSMKDTNVINTLSPYLLDKLQQHKNDLTNELLTYLGINNTNTDKKERMLVSEVNSNNDFIMINIDHMFDVRKRACELINEMFNVNITVKKREVQFDGEYNNDIDGNNAA